MYENPTKIIIIIMYSRLQLNWNVGIIDLQVWLAYDPAAQNTHGVDEFMSASTEPAVHT